MLERLFKLSVHKTTVHTEVMAGLTTFLAMAYILFINPSILNSTGMNKGSVFVATCLASAIGSILMGFIANYPIALAPGMGLNAFFAYTVVLQMGYTWQIALGAVFLSALIFFILSIFKIRKWIINSIPLPLRSGITAGIGLFLAVVAFQSSGIIVDNQITLIGLGDLTRPGPLFAILGFIIIIILEAYFISGAVLIGVLTITFLSIITECSSLYGIISMPPSITPTFLKLDIYGALDVSLISVVFAFLFIDVFDNTGTLIGVTKRAGLTDNYNSTHKMSKALIADSTAALFGALLGTSTTTSYIESATGVSAGGRTGLTAIVVGIMFLISLFFAPLASSIPAFATAPALLFVAVIMTASLAEIDWKDITVAAPIAMTALIMPLTYSIANGIMFGFITWTILKLLTKRYHDLNISLIILSILFIIKLGWLNT